MGQADEGESIVAVLAGEGSGGHKAGVVCVTFHPQYRAVVTGGLDWQIRIWALPEFPKPVDSRIRTRTKLGYRPEVIYHPVFATGRLHTEALDWVEW
jgi:polycomb protein EED